MFSCTQLFFLVWKIAITIDFFIILTYPIINIFLFNYEGQKNDRSHYR